MYSCKLLIATALRGGLMTKSGRLELGGKIYGHYRSTSIFNHAL